MKSTGIKSTGLNHEYEAESNVQGCIKSTGLNWMKSTGLGRENGSESRVQG